MQYLEKWPHCETNGQGDEEAHNGDAIKGDDAPCWPPMMMTKERWKRKSMFSHDEHHGNDRRASRGKTHNHKFQPMDFRLHQAHRHLQSKEIDAASHGKAFHIAGPSNEAVSSEWHTVEHTGKSM